jgi:acylphosphatase
VIVTGRVQGVGFRYSACARAESLGVSGWMKNRLDGNVEAVFEGPRERVELLVRWCRQGPSGAYVDEMEVQWQEPKDEKGFAIR